MNYYNDNDVTACAWLRQLIAARLIPDGEVDERSIEEVSVDNLRGFAQCHFFAGIGGWSYALQLAGWSDTEPVWTGSCPCQPISRGGLHRGHADKRHLWPAFYKLISECRPSTIFGEQVAGTDGREWFAGVRSDFEGIGYACGCADMCATAFGIPQHRERLFFVAMPTGANSTRRREIGRRERCSQEVETHRRYADWRKSCEAGVLDDGLSVGMAKNLIKGFGNSIVPQVAAEFIQAACQV
jgi:DNA (cytosine-5)-methyltransferase 1